MSWLFNGKSALCMVGAREIGQQLTAQVAFLEDLGSISNTHMAAHDHL